ncbi:MAG TPA: molybdate ABC transporter permease subunit [Candidatus Acidoferrales bacterium]|jgi:molybdate transport system permease protein|nr:molybdate ABC transporter permease subunit [Candidatus Acidoferrales bacterium]
MSWQAFVLTAKLAFLTAIILLVLGLPIAFWIAFSPRRWKFVIEAVVGMPLVLPPTVLGFYLLLAFGSGTAFGRWYQHLTGSTLAFTFSGLVVASVLYSLPFAVHPMVAGIRAVDPRLIDAARTLGADKHKIYGQVVLPLAWPGLLTGVVLSFAHTVGEFGVVLMVGGNIPGATRTLSIDIYDQVQSLHYSAANQTALVLLLFSYFLLCLVYGLNRRSFMWAGR